MRTLSGSGWRIGVGDIRAVLDRPDRELRELDRHRALLRERKALMDCE